MEGVLTVVDFEGSRSSGVFETGMVRIDSGRIVSVFTALHRPRAELSVAERVLCGVEGEKLADKQPFSEFYDRFVAARRDGLLAAHNATTEHHLLLDAFPFPPAGIAPEGGTLTGWGPWVDTLLLARRFLPDIGQYGLGEVVRILGLQGTLEDLAAACCPADRCRPHAALYDALASALVLLDFAGRGWVGSVREALLACEGPAERLTQGELF